MRGKLNYIALLIHKIGITPAHAGKTTIVYPESAPEGDHPRACGENQSSPTPAHNNIGSPPRMRGKLLSFSMPIASSRITPAHAGKTIVYDFKYVKLQDHPRACGENQTHGNFLHGFSGSPPRMRGKLSTFVRVDC